MKPLPSAASTDCPKLARMLFRRSRPVSTFSRSSLSLFSALLHRLQMSNFSRPQGPPTRPLRIENDYAEPAGTPVRTMVNVGYVYIIIFAILLLALICLFVGCLYVCFKRQKVRQERRKRLLVAVPPCEQFDESHDRTKFNSIPASELSKLGLGHLWWSGKAAISNDALLNHDYMVSSNSTREGLSVSTDVGSPATSSAGSPGHSGPEQGALSGPSTDTTDDHRDLSSASNQSAKTEPKTYSEWRAQILANREKQLHPPVNGSPLVFYRF